MAKSRQQTSISAMINIHQWSTRASRVMPGKHKPSWNRWMTCSRQHTIIRDLVYSSCESIDLINLLCIYILYIPRCSVEMPPPPPQLNTHPLFWVNYIYSILPTILISKKDLLLKKYCRSLIYIYVLSDAMTIFKFNCTGILNGTVYTCLLVFTGYRILLFL